MTEDIKTALNAILALVLLGNLLILIGSFREYERRGMKRKGMIGFVVGSVLYAITLSAIMDAVIYGTFLLSPGFAWFLAIAISVGCGSYAFGSGGKYVSRAGQFSLEPPEGWVKAPSAVPEVQKLGGVAFIDRKGGFVNVIFRSLETNRSTDPALREQQVIEHLLDRALSGRHTIAPGAFRPARSDMNIAAAALITELPVDHNQLRGSISIVKDKTEYVISYGIRLPKSKPIESSPMALYKFVYSFRFLDSPEEELLSADNWGFRPGVIAESFPAPTLSGIKEG